ncbi:MAG: hypothetical protein HYV63_08675 [Candidatus Schekmanbacteria bacterium]|nr:hypothetical protein [Candidatus Schekmanbacteria bacterium]
MSKKNKPTHTSAGEVIARAEQMLARGNFLLALRGFKEAERLGAGAELTAKIALCDREIRKETADRLVKNARRLQSAGKVEEARAALAEAHALLPEDAAVGERCAALEDAFARQQGAHLARIRLQAGDLSGAAELFAANAAALADDSSRRVAAQTLLAAGRDGEALAILERISQLAEVDRYAYGLALARLGRHADCLVQWRQIAGDDPELAAQRMAVRALWTADLYARAATPGDLGKLLAEGRELLAYGEDPERLGPLLRHCRVGHFRELWLAGRFAEIAALLDPEPSERDPVWLAFYAKLFRRLAEMDATFVAPLSRFWLSAVLSPELAAGSALDPAGREWLRNELVQMGEAILRRHADAQAPGAAAELAVFLAEKQVLAELSAVAGTAGSSLPLPLLSPRLALGTPHQESLRAFTIKHAAAFASHFRFLETAAFYSTAAASMLLLEEGEYERAYKSLPAAAGSEVQRYARDKVTFFFGLCCMDTGRTVLPDFYDRASDYLAAAPGAENDIVALARDAVEQSHLAVYEALLDRIYRERPRPELARALSLVITYSDAVAYMAGTKAIADSVAALQRALELDPANQLARTGLDAVQQHRTMRNLVKALDRGKLDRACAIAAESGSSDVRDAFFEELGQMLAHLDAHSAQCTHEIPTLEQMHRWAERLDPHHPTAAAIRVRMAQCRKW